MKNQKINIIFLFLSQFIFSQIYNVGFSSEKINPNNTIISSPLAGYGDPNAGRFSIDFIEIGGANNVVAMCSNNTKLIAVSSDNKLWIREISLTNSNWTFIGMAYNITAITYGNGKLYATDKNNILWMSNFVNYNLSWINIGHAYKVTGMTFLNNNLYATDETNFLWQKDTINNSVNWINIGHANDVRSLTNDGVNLIAATKNKSELWIRNTESFDQPWTKIGTQNGLNYNKYITNISYVNNILYSISNNNKLNYSKHSESDIFARVAYFEKNINKALIITLDLCGIDYSFSKKIKDKINQEFNIDKKSILINCSHTHFAPVSQNYFCMQEFYQKPNPKYMEIVLSRILQATKDAILNKETSNLYFSKGKTCIGHNRADISKGIDDNITLVTSKKANKNILNGMFFSGSCHPVFKNDDFDYYKINSNYIGQTISKLSFIKNCNKILFMQGCSGDINPNDIPDITSDILSNDISNLTNSSLITGDLFTKFDSIHIPLNNFTLEEAINIKNENSGIYNTDSERNVRWADRIIEQYSNNNVPNSICIYIQIFNIGDWKIIALSREAVSQYAIDLYSENNNTKLTVLGYTNDVASYLPVDWHIQNNVQPSNYEGYISFLLYGQSGIPIINVKTLILNKINSML